MENTEVGFLVQKIEDVKKAVELGFGQVNQRFQRLEENHEKISMMSAAHEERFKHHRELIEKTAKDLNEYSNTRVQVDRDQYEKINENRTAIQDTKTAIETAKTELLVAMGNKDEKQSEKSGNLVFKWVPLIVSMLTGLGLLIAFVKGALNGPK